MKKIFSFLCILLFSSYIAQAQITLLGSENFDSGPNHGFTFSPSNGTMVDNTYSLSTPNALWIPIPMDEGDSVMVTTPMYDCDSMSRVLLRFNHICKVATSDEVRIEYRIDGFSNQWTPIPASSYRGNSKNYANNGFNAASYAIWNSQDSTFLPNNNLWKEEYFDLTNEVSFEKVSFRFIIKKGKVKNSVINYGWLIDDIELFGSIDHDYDSTMTTVELVAPTCYFLNSSYEDKSLYERGPFTIQAKVASRTSAPIIPPYLIYSASHPTGTIYDTLAMNAYEGDSLWEATIPMQLIGTTITYAIHAKDSLGNTANAYCGFETKHLSSGGKGGEFIVGDTTSSTTTYYAPYHYNYNYAWTKTLYLSNEFSKSGGKITNIAYKCSTNTNVNDNISIYMKATTVTSLDIAYEDPIATGATLVWQGTCTPTREGGWYDLELQNNFSLPQGQNLLVFVVSRDASWQGNGSVYWYTSPAPESNMCVYKYLDASFPEDNGTVLTSRPITRFNFLSYSGSPDSNAIALTQIMLNDTLPTSATSQTPIAVKIKNVGYKNLTSATINWTINGVAQTPYNWTGNIFDADVDSLIIGTYTPTLNAYDTLVIWASMPNGVIDTTTYDDTLIVSPYGSADIILSWETFPADTMPITGPNKVAVYAHSISGQPIPPIDIVYTYKDTLGNVVGSVTIPTTTLDTIIWEADIINVPFWHSVEVNAVTTDFLNNQIIIADTFFIEKRTSDGLSNDTAKIVGNINTTITNNAPYTISNKYGWSKSLYKHNELGTNYANLTINKIAYKAQSRNGGDSTENLTCYMKAVDVGFILDSSYIDPATDASLTLVWSGSIYDLDTNWIELTLNTPFHIIGNQDLLVYWVNNNATFPSINNNNINWYSEKTITNSCVANAADNAMPTTDGNYTYRPITRFDITQQTGVNSMALLAVDNLLDHAPAGKLPISASIKNVGNNHLTSCIFNIAVNNVIQNTISWTGDLDCDFSMTNISLGDVILSEGFNNVAIWVEKPNGISDINTSDDTIYQTIVSCYTNTTDFTIGPYVSNHFSSISDFIQYTKHCPLQGKTTISFETLITGTYKIDKIDLSPLAEIMTITDTLIITSLSGNPRDVVFEFSDSAFILANNKNIYIQNITIDATKKAAMTGILFLQPCDNIEINNCVINVSTTATAATTRGIYYSGSTSKPAMGDIRILNNTINGGYYGIYLYYLHPNTGSIASDSGIVTIKGNNITNFYYYGIYAHYGRYDFISKNTITSRNASATQYGMYVYSYNRIDSGIIGNTIKMQGTSTSYGIYPYYLNHQNTRDTNNIADTNSALIANNIISKTNNGTFYGIYIYYSNIDVLHNTVVGKGNSLNYCLYLSTMSSTYNAVIKNNMFAAIKGTAAYPIYASSANYVLPTYGVTLDYNNYYSYKKDTIGYISRVIPTLAALQNRTQQNYQSKNIAPIWDDTNKFTLQNYSSFLAPNVGVDNDIENETRILYTPMGAYTFSSLDSIDLSLEAISFTSDSNKVISCHLKLFNAGNIPITNATINWSIDSVIQPSKNWAGNLTNIGDTGSITLGIIPLGNHIITTWISNVNGVGNDSYSANDTISAQRFVCDKTLSGNYTIGGSSADYVSIDDAIISLCGCGVNAPVTFNINPGTYNVTKDIEAIPSSSTTNTITFTSATGNVADVIIKADSNQNALSLSNTSDLRFINLTIDATIGTSAVVFDGVISNVTFYGCDILGDTTTSSNTKKTINYTSSSSGVPVSLIDVKIIKNNIIGGYYGIYFYYPTIVDSLRMYSNIIIDSNNISKFYSHGIYAGYRGHYNSISYNTISTRSASTAQYGIYLYYYNIVDTIVSNKILLNGSAASYGIYASYHNNATTQLTFIANNEIRKVSGLAGTTSGIYINYAQADIFNNSVYINGTDEANGIYFYSMSTAYHTNLKNNIFVTNGTNISYPLRSYSLAYLKTYVTLDYNNYYSNNGTLGYIGTSSTVGKAVNSLKSLQDTINQDSNSISILPEFIDTLVNLDIVNYNEFLVPNVGVKYDIRNRRRIDEITIMGAYSLETIDGRSVQLTSINGLPDTTKRCHPNTITSISYTITAVGVDSIDFAIDPLFLHLSMKGSINLDTVITIQKGMLGTYQSETIEILKDLNIYNNEQFNVSAWISSSWDNIKTDDSLFTDIKISRTILPMDENFTNGIPNNISIDGNTDSTWTLVATNDAGTITPQFGNQMLAFNAENRGVSSTLTLSSVNLSQTLNPSIEFWYWHDITAHTKDFTSIQLSLDGGISFKTIFTVNKNNGVDTGWVHYSIPLNNYQEECVIIEFYAIKWSPDIYDAKQYIDRIIISGEYDLGITAIQTSDIDVCKLTGHSLDVVVSSVTYQEIDFTSMSTALQVEISGDTTASYNIPLNTGTISGLSNMILNIDNNFNFTPGTYYIKAMLTTAIDGNSSNDILYDTIIVNPELTITPTQITGGTSITNCLAVGAKVNQEVNITNSGNMDMDNLTLTLNIYNSSGVVVETINENLPYLLSSGEDTTYTFTSAYTVPDDESFNVEVIVHPTCNNSLTYNNSVVECIDVRNVVISQFIEPTDDNTCSDVASRQKITVRVCNRTPNQDMRNISINAVVSTEGSQINAFKEVIDNLSINDSIDFTFSQSFIVPEANNYTIQVYIDKIDDTNDDDTLSITKCTNLGISELKVNTIGMSQNMPNPANNMAKVNYTIPSQGKVVFTITSITGQILHTQTIEAEAGANNIEFNTAHLADGIYFYTMDFNGHRLTKKMTIKK